MLHIYLQSLLRHSTHAACVEEFVLLEGKRNVSAALCCALQEGLEPVGIGELARKWMREHSEGTVDIVRVSEQTIRRAESVEREMNVLFDIVERDEREMSVK